MERVARQHEPGRPASGAAERGGAYGRSTARRLLVKPGITGLWQVSGRSDLSWEDSVRLDLYYVENWSFAGDIQILWKTVSAVVQRPRRLLTLPTVVGGRRYSIGERPTDRCAVPDGTLAGVRAARRAPSRGCSASPAPRPPSWSASGDVLVDGADRR